MVTPHHVKNNTLVYDKRGKRDGNERPLKENKKGGGAISMAASYRFDCAPFFKINKLIRRVIEFNTLDSIKYIGHLKT